MLGTVTADDLILLREYRRRTARAAGVGQAAPVFRGAADEAQRITAPAWIIAGPAETGKTWAALWRLDAEASQHARSQWAIVRKLRSTMDGSVLATYRRIVETSKSGATPYGGERPQWYDYPNGARVWVGGLDNPDKVLSSERDGIYVNQAEELTEEDWETLGTRATGRGAVTTTPMLFGDCNPGPSDHWIIRKRDAGSIVLLESKHEDNPTLFDEQGQLTNQGRRSMAILDALTGVRYQRLRMGRWVGAEGQFFTAWDEALHVCQPFQIPGDWIVWGAFDYGFAHNTAFGVFARGTDGAIYLVGEHVQNKALPVQHSAAMAGLLSRLSFTPARLRTIAAGLDVFQQRGDTTGRTIADQYADLGWQFEPASVDRINGAAELLLRLGNATQAPRLKVFSTCPRTILTIPRMVHDPKRAEDVLKIDADAEGNGGDDAYDMLRYGLMVDRDMCGFYYSYDKRGRR